MPTQGIQSAVNFTIRCHLDAQREKVTASQRVSLWSATHSSHQQFPEARVLHESEIGECIIEAGVMC